MLKDYTLKYCAVSRHIMRTLELDFRVHPDDLNDPHWAKDDHCPDGSPEDRGREADHLPEKVLHTSKVHRNIECRKMYEYLPRNLVRRKHNTRNERPSQLKRIPKVRSRIAVLIAPHMPPPRCTKEFCWIQQVHTRTVKYIT